MDAFTVGGERQLRTKSGRSTSKAGGAGSEGRRCEPLTVRDEFSRYVLELRTLENARYETVRAAFERLFQQHGLPAAIRSDNGSPFASTKRDFRPDAALRVVAGFGH